MELKLGKKAARPGAVRFKFSDVVDLSQMAAPPANFGHDGSVKAAWGMKGNDVAGDCVFAATAHNIMLWCAEAGMRVSISDKTTLHNYSLFTNYDPAQTDPVTGENSTDVGTDVADWLSHWRKVGFIDDKGVAHKIGAYLSLNPQNPDEMRYAAYYFDGVMLGVNFPQQWMDTFDKGGRTWGALKNPNYVGGHCITTVAYRDKRPYDITWGTGVEVTLGAITQTCDEAYAILTPEKISKGVDANGISYAKLSTMLSQLKTVR